MKDPVAGNTKDPLTARGRRTRATLVEAARQIFERDGFVAARVTDIADAAGVAHGTFYTYFESKEDIFAEVVRQVSAELFEEIYAGGDAQLDPISKIRESNRQYLRSYRRHAGIMAVIEQMVFHDPQLRDLRRAIRDRFVERVERAFSRFERDGLIDPGLDLHVAANALVSMVDRFAYLWFVLGEPFDEGSAVDTLTRLWVNAIRLDVTATRSLADQAVSRT